MPAGRPWFARTPEFRTVPPGPLWHVYDERFGPLTANPYSRGRLALVGTHSMFYTADSLAGALWETVLRYVEPDASGVVTVRPGLLTGVRAIRVHLDRPDIPLLELGQPGLRRLFATDSEEAVAVAKLLHDPVHAHTHAEAHQLQQDLRGFGVDDMPVLSWPSRQLNTSTVYLAYVPPMDASWWSLVGTPLALDDPHTGYPALQTELTHHGFTWTPLATTATPPGAP